MPNKGGRALSGPDPADTMSHSVTGSKGRKLGRAGRTTCRTSGEKRCADEVWLSFQIDSFFCCFLKSWNKAQPVQCSSERSEQKPRFLATDPSHGAGWNLSWKNCGVSFLLMTPGEQAGTSNCREMRWYPPETGLAMHVEGALCSGVIWW